MLAYLAGFWMAELATHGVGGVGLTEALLLSAL
jgi:hypothetical protein